jgi:hypothetical protein
MSQTSNRVATPPKQTASSWRYRLGMILFFGAFPIFLATPVVIPFLGLSAMESATLIGGILLVVEVLWIASIPLLGKAGFKDVKEKAFGWLKLAERPMSRMRQRSGVVLLVTSLVLDVLLQLLVMVQHFGAATAANQTPELLGLSFAVQSRLYIGLQLATATGVLVALILLGGGFWERLKRAFEWQPEA